MGNKETGPSYHRRLAALASATGIAPDEVPFVRQGRPTGDDGMSKWRSDRGSINIVYQGKSRSKARAEFYDDRRANAVRARRMYLLNHPKKGDD